MNNFRVPRTGYAKMMDFWQVISLALPFLEVILHTMLQNVKKNGRESIRTVRPINQTEGIHFELTETNSIEKLIRNVATYGITIIYVLLLIGFFLIGIFWS